MTAPDPDSLGLIAKVGAAFAVATAPLVYLHRELKKKADKDEVAEKFLAVAEELKTQRSYVAKLFDQIRENDQRAQDRHEDVMKAVYTRSEK